jgi:hypothetical protein
MKNEKLTKKEIAKNVRATRRVGFGNGFDYDATVRGFYFETLRDKECGVLMECDDQGHLTHVGSISSKKEAVNAIFEWFINYAPQHFETNNF